MKTLLFMTLFVTVSANAGEAEKKAFTCKKGFEVHACKEVKGAKREFFCWKDKQTISAKRKDKVCKSLPKKKRLKKVVKK